MVKLALNIMPTSFKGYPDHRPNVAYFARKTSADIALIKKLIENDCKVSVITNEKYFSQDEFFKEEKHEKALFIKDPQQSLLKEKYSYVIYSGLIPDHVTKTNFENKIFDMAIKFGKDTKKSIFLFPSTVNKSYKKYIDENTSRLNDSLIILTPEVLSNKDVSYLFGISNLLFGELNNNIVKKPHNNAEFSIISSEKFSENTLRLIFSFFDKRKTISLKTHSVDVGKIILLAKNKEQGLREKEVSLPETEFLATDQTISVKTNYRREVPKLLKNNLKKNKAENYEVKQIPKLNKETINKNKIAPKKIVKKRLSQKKTKRRKKRSILKSFPYGKMLAFVSSAFFCLPYTLLLIAVALLIFSNIINNFVRTTFTKIPVEVSREINNIASSYSHFFNEVSYVGKVFYPAVKTSDIFSVASSVETSKLKIKEKYLILAKQITGDESYNLEKISDELAAETESLYLKISLLQGETEKLPDWTKTLLTKTFILQNTVEQKEDLLYEKKLLTRLPILLGKEESMSYLVLLFDNRKLRAVGGTVPSFGIVTFEDGKIASAEFYKTKETDKMLRGDVLPPEPLRKYRGINSWSLEDVGWDPEFLYSAQKAEWFLDKEMSRPVNGVVGMDLAFWYDIFQKNPKNFYSDNTPFEFLSSYDSQEKDKFLENMFWKLTEYIKEEKSDVFNKKNDWQFFLHDNISQKALLELGLGGIMQTSDRDCLTNCYFDYAAVIEDNLGDSANSLSIERTSQIKINIEERLIKREVALLLKNNSDEVYKNYVRVMAPANVGFGKVDIIKDGIKKSMDPETFGIHGRKEAGVLVEIGPQKDAVLVFRWESESVLNTDIDGAYFFKIEKQEGKKPHDLAVLFNLPDDLEVRGERGFFLTELGEYGYNTSLSRDVISRIFWTKK